MTTTSPARFILVIVGRFRAGRPWSPPHCLTGTVSLGALSDSHAPSSRWDSILAGSSGLAHELVTMVPDPAMSAGTTTLVTRSDPSIPCKRTILSRAIRRGDLTPQTELLGTMR